MAVFPSGIGIVGAGFHVSMQPFSKVWKMLLVLFAAGIALFFLFSGSIRGRGAVYYSNLFFTVSSVYMCVGLVIWVHNVGMFNTLKYGMKVFVRLFRGKREEVNDRLKGGYLEYVDSRKKAADAPWMFLMFAVFLTLSILVSLL